MQGHTFLWVLSNKRQPTNQGYNIWDSIVTKVIFQYSGENDYLTNGNITEVHPSKRNKFGLCTLHARRHIT